MTTVSPRSELPAYSDFVSQIERPRTVPRVAARWPFVVLIVLGAVLVIAPIVSGMFPRAVKGEAMIEAFRPYATEQSIAEFRDDLGVLDGARANVLALRESGQQPGSFERVDTFVRDYPGIRTDISGMVDAIDANRDNYRKLSSTTSFGALPWLLALPGLLLIAIGWFGLRSVRHGRRALGWHATAAIIGLGLVLLPFTGGLFQAAPAAQPLLDGFRPILTQEQVRRVQGYFVTLVAADGELNSRYVGAVRGAHPGADLTGVTALEQRWQPMTARFAGLVGVMNDNVENFDAVVALNDATRPLGFTAFRGLGWGFLIPGVLVLGTAAAGVRPRRTATAESSVGEEE
ncbi:hypothetical protein LTV02_38800 [Nocardia yamanashiensis]|uniref:hypothetical protein n=1 Tax=Nocardia yamanashiensis TaxID=209247 RepID=UPI001E5B11D7|nr:hypothetical protein [Nocardia yamanashiensis]UGT41789.1 hypothetical protein LTV02_38800 [Nocardia yamanashiensis]